MQLSRQFHGVLLAAFLLFPAQLLSQSDTIQTNVPHLKAVFARDFAIGCLLSYRHVGFPSDPYVPGQSGVVSPNGGNLIAAAESSRIIRFSRQPAD